MEPNFLQRVGAALQGGDVAARMEQQMRDAQVAQIFKQNQGGDVRELLKQASSVDPAYARELIRLEMANQGIGVNTPAALQEWAAFQKMPPQDKAAYLGMKRAQQVVNLGGTQAVLSPTGGIAENYPVTPKPEQMPEFQAGQEAAKTTARLGATAEDERQKKANTAGTTLDLIQQARKVLPEASSGLSGSIGAGLKGAAGISDEATQADKKLQVIAGALTASVPRFEGPQGVLDVELYKQMAADVANISKPREDRLAALDAMEELQNRYKKNAKPQAPQNQALADKLKRLEELRALKAQRDAQ